MAASSSAADGKDGEKSRRIRSGKKGHVKRPMNAFMIWGRAERRRLAAEYPTASNGDLSRLLGYRWNAMNDDEKQPFIVEAERLRIEHQRLFPDYKYNPRPPRRRLGDASPGDQQAYSASTFERSTQIKNNGSSQELISILQQCPLSDLLNALAAKVTSTTHHHEPSKSSAVSKEARCSDGCQDKMLGLDSSASQLSSPLKNDVSLADIYLSQLGNEEHPRPHDDGASSSPRTVDQASDPWEVGELGAPHEPSTFWTASWPSDDHSIERPRDLHYQSSTLAALPHPSSSWASLANDSSMDTWSRSYECIPSTCESSATGAAGTTQAVTLTDAGQLFPYFYLPITGWF